MGRAKHKQKEKKTLVIGAMVVQLSEVDGTGNKYLTAGRDNLPFLPS
jgi:hypothetical protein